MGDRRPADPPDPFDQFGAWYDEAQRAGQFLPNATSLSTVGADGRPASRMVLLSSFDRSGFVFHTNYESRKAAELAATPRAALLFWWSSLDRQVRIEGTAAKTRPEESDAYFAGRPRGAQLGAWASSQSRPLAARETLEARVREVAVRYGEDPVPRPPYWGGFRLAPTMFEFWAGRTDRLHERIRYDRSPEGWTDTILYP